jgi:single-stranded-DNA-specific exonuclease
MKWHKQPIDAREVRDLAERYALDLLQASIFVRRGITEGTQLKFYLESDLRFLHNPFLMDEMEDAVERVLQAQTEGERVHVFGDRDVDGVTSTVLTVETLQSLGLEVSWAVPTGEDPYGLTMEQVDRCAAADVTLLVVVDCGTSNVAEIAYAQSLGIDTIVVDHHNPQPERPPAVAIVNPKLPDSSYPFDGLCACALAAKFRWALMFAQTDFYKQPLCLLNVRPGNGSVVLEAVKLENLIEIDRITENLVPGVVRLEETRLAGFLQGIQILVFEAEPAERLLREAFGQNVVIGLIDVAPEIRRLFPSLAQKSLFRLRTESRLGRYGGAAPEEIDVFASLFHTFVMRRETVPAEGYQDALDLVAIGSLADMMPMVDENRIAVRAGLQRCGQTSRPALRLLLERQRLLGKQIDARDVGWSLSPILNAAGRMGEADVAVRFLLSREETEQQQLLQRIMDLNEQRRQVGDQAWGQVRAQALSSFEQHQGRFVFVHGEGIHRGVTGIVAGKLARQFNAPAAVVSVLDGRAVGSVRSARGLVATELLARMDDLVIDWGGHDAAAGFHLERDRLQELGERLQQVIPELEIEEAREALLRIDAELPAEYFTPKLADVVKLFAPFGQENPPLTFLVRGVRLPQIDFMGKTQEHLRLLVEAGSTKWPAVYWSAAEKVGTAFDAHDPVDVVFSYGTNFYNGTERPRLTILDIRRAAQGAEQ